MQLLTYLAQVRQLPCKNVWLQLPVARIMPHILHIKPSKKPGISRKGIVIIGIVRAVVWDAQNRNTDVWSMVVELSRKSTIFTLSQSPVAERKYLMNTRKKTMENGLTGFWMRVDHKLNVRVVNGTMYKLLKGKNAFILTHILSRHMHRQLLRARLYASRKNRGVKNYTVSYPRVYGLIGLKARSKSRGWASNTTLLVSKAQREQAAMSPSTYLNPPFSRLIGLKAGSASDTVKAFQMRRSGKQTP